MVREPMGSWDRRQPLYLDIIIIIRSICVNKWQEKGIFQFPWLRVFLEKSNSTFAVWINLTI
jgi:hypothetical protein